MKINKDRCFQIAIAISIIAMFTRYVIIMNEAMERAEENQQFVDKYNGMIDED